MDPGQVWATITQNAKLIMWLAASFFVVIAVLTLAAHMEFKSVGRFYLGELDAKARPAPREGGFDFAGGDQADLGSEIEIMRSESLISRAILSSGLNTWVGPTGWKAPRYWRWLLSGRDVSLLDVGVREISVLNAALDDQSRGKQDYRILVVNRDTYQLWQNDQNLGEGPLGQPRKFPGITLTVSSADGRVLEPQAEYELRVYPIDETVTAAEKKLFITFPKAATQGETARVLSVEFREQSPHLAAEFLRRLMTLYLDERQGWKTEEASAAQLFVTGQLRSLRESLDGTEQRLAEYRSNNRVVVLDSEAKSMIEQLGKYEEQRVAARLQVASLTDMKRALSDPNARLEAFLVGDAQDTVLDGLATSLTQQRQELSSLQERFSDAAPEVREKRAQIEAQLGMIRNYVTNRLNRAQDSLRTLNDVITQHEGRLETVPGAELGLVQLARESEVYSKMYSYLLERQQQAAITKASTVSRNRILDMPKVPYREDSPSLAVRVPLAFLGLLLAAFAVLARQLFSTKLQTELDARILAGVYPVLSTLPLRANRGGSSRTLASLDELTRDQASPFTEAMRLLRTQVTQHRADPGGQVILFSSATPRDGKTTTAISLAIMLVADNKNVLLIDGDLRKPSHHRLLGQAQSPGLSTVLSKVCDWRTAVNPVSTRRGEFYTMTTGEFVSLELLSGSELPNLIRNVRQRFDYVLIDTTSFPLASDALLLAPLADLVISVMRLHHTPRRLAAEHLRGMSRAARTLRVVINGGIPGGAYGNAPPDSGAPPKRASTGHFKARVIR